MSIKTLHKKELSAMDKMDVFLMKHSTIILTLLFLLLFIMIGTLIVVIAIQCGNNASMTDSGTLYNHLQDVI